MTRTWITTQLAAWRRKRGAARTANASRRLAARHKADARAERLERQRIEDELRATLARAERAEAERDVALRQVELLDAWVQKWLERQRAEAALQAARQIAAPDLYARNHAEIDYGGTD